MKYYSNYEINVALNGNHLFATHKRSLTCESEVKMLYKIFKDKFPTSEGYEISIEGRSTYGKYITADIEKEVTDNVL